MRILGMKRVAPGLGLALALAMVSVPFADVAEATTSVNKISLYIDQPFVQGSYVASALDGNGHPIPGTSTVDFTFTGPNGVSCSTANITDTITFTETITFTGACELRNGADYGGATVGPTVSAPTIGGTGWTPFATTNDSSDPVIITLAEPSRYLGFWWSSGNSTNYIDFFSKGELVLSLESSTITSLLGAGPANGADTTTWRNRIADDNLNLSDLNQNLAYRSIEYFGNPRGYAMVDGELTGQTAWAIHEPFVYVHLFAEGAVSFDRVELSGTGFEFDNLVVSTKNQVPNPRLVFVTSVESEPDVLFEHTVTFDGNGDNVVGTIADQTATQPTSLTSNSFRRSGFRFTGWNTAADGSGTSYADGATYNFFADVTLYAQWAAVAASTNKKPALADDEVAVVPLLAATGGELPPYPLVIAGIIAAGVVLTVVSRRRRSEVGY